MVLSAALWSRGTLLLLLLALPTQQTARAEPQHTQVLPPHRQASYELPASAEELMSCINSNQDHAEATTWQSAMSAAPAANLQVVSTWWSTKAATVPLTMTTQLSVSRIWQLKALCMTYDGPVSAVVHRGIRVADGLLSAAAVLRDDVEKVGKLFSKLEIRGLCKLDIMLVREMYHSEAAQLWYPVNQLRNYARLQARTPLIGLIDGDLLVSPVLVSELRDYATQHKLVDELTRCRAAYVLPAFMTLAPQVATAASAADRAVVGTKDALRALFRRGVVQRFDPTAPGHVATDYSRWFQSDAPYEVKYAARYEPWVMVDRYHVPFYDIAFRGYGLNKIIHLESMNSTGYRFVVHPHAFVVHRAHAASSARRAHRVGVRLNRRRTQRTLATQAAQQQQEQQQQQLQEVQAGLHPQHVSNSAAPGDRLQQQQQQQSQQQQKQQQRQPQAALRESSDRRQLRSQRETLAAGGASYRVPLDGHTAPTTTRRMAQAFEHVRALGTAARQRMAEGTYQPLIDNAVRHCAATLPWWKKGALDKAGAAWCPRCT